MSDFEETSHLAQLGLLQEILNEAGMSTNLLEKSEALPLHVLLAGIHQDVKGRDRYLHFSFLPLNEEHVSAIQLLQLYSKLPFEFPADARDAVAPLLMEINASLPIGHFGVEESDELHYRYVYAMSAARSFEREEVLEIIGLFVSMYDMFAEQAENRLSPNH